MQQVITTFQKLLPDFVSEASAQIITSNVPVYAELPPILVQDALFHAISSLGQDLQLGTASQYPGYWQMVARQRARQGISPVHSMQVTFLSTAVMTSNLKHALGDHPAALAWWLERMHNIISLGMQVMTEARIEAMREIGGLPLLEAASLRVEPLTIYMLGDWQVQRGMHTIPAWPRRAAQLLLALLATFGGQWLHREEICELLWPGVPAAAAASRFKVALHALMTTLTPDRSLRDASPYIQRTDSSYRLNPDPRVVAVDALLFEEELERAELLAAEAPRLAAYETALRRYVGPLLPNNLYADWSHAARERLTLRFLRSACAVARLYLQLNQPQHALRWATAALQQDATCDDAHRLQVEAHLALNQPMLAHRARLRYAQTLSELGILG